MVLIRFLCFRKLKVPSDFIKSNIEGPQGGIVRERMPTQSKDAKHSSSGTERTIQIEPLLVLSVGINEKTQAY